MWFEAAKGRGGRCTDRLTSWTDACASFRKDSFVHLAQGPWRKRAYVFYIKSTSWRVPLGLGESTFAAGQATSWGSFQDFEVFPNVEGAITGLDKHFQKPKIALDLPLVPQIP